MMNGKDKGNSAFSIHNSELIVPAIRFKGFGGEWVEKKLTDLTDKGFSNGVFNDPQKVGKGYRLINVKDMYLGDYINVDSLSLVDIDEKEFKNNKVEYGDIFFTRSSLVKEGIAYSNVNLSNRHDLTFDGHLIRMQPCKITTDPIFLAYLFKTSSARKQFILGGKTTTMTTIGQSDIAIVELALPEKPEQTQIGNYFQKLDSLINQHQQKHDKLSNIKKAMLERMFPKQGENIPEIRFKGFSEEWEDKELRQIATYRNGKAHEQSIAENGRYIVVNSKFVSTNGEVKKYSNEQISPLVKNEICFVLSDVPNGKAIARTFLIAKDNLYTLNQRIAGITPSETSHHYFLYILLNRNPYFLKFDDGAKQTNLSVSDVESFTSPYPSVEEQTQIGNYFQKLDALINQHQQQITKLNNIKQACLNKMFV